MSVMWSGREPDLGLNISHQHPHLHLHVHCHGQHFGEDGEGEYIVPRHRPKPLFWATKPTRLHYRTGYMRTALGKSRCRAGQVLMVRDAHNDGLINK